MKLGIPCAVLLAGIAFEHAAASPLLLIKVTQAVDVPSHNLPIPLKFRLGHAAGLSMDPTMMAALASQPILTQPSHKKHHCMHHLKAAFDRKTSQIANSFRLFFGLPTPPADEPMMSILPYNPDSDHHSTAPSESSERLWSAFGHPEMIQSDSPMDRIVYHAPGGHRAHHLHHKQKDFIHRLNRALDSLGAREGLAVAFVLGCGLGALIRMFYVFAVLFVRSFRGQNGYAAIPTADSEHLGQEHVLVVEEVFALPPSYNDEKAPIEVDQKTSVQ